MRCYNCGSAVLCISPLSRESSVTAQPVAAFKYSDSEVATVTSESRFGGSCYGRLLGPLKAERERRQTRPHIHPERPVHDPDDDVIDRQVRTVAM